MGAVNRRNLSSEGEVGTIKYQRCFMVWNPTCSGDVLETVNELMIPAPARNKWQLCGEQWRGSQDLKSAFLFPFL